MSLFQALIAEGGFEEGYYVSQSGTGSGANPFVPMSLADFLLVTLVPTDKVFFKRGDSFDLDELTITVNSVTFGAYGSGADPKFYGSDTLSGATWTSETGGYYSTPLATEPLWVFNPAGEAARQGQSDWIPTTAETSGTTRTFLAATLNAFNSVEALTTAKARFKEFNFRMSWPYNISAYNTGTGQVTFNVTVVGVDQIGLPMKLYGQKQFATLEGDWWYDDPNNKLWIKTASDPTGLDWRVCTENYGFKVQSDNVTVSGLEFTQYYEAAIRTESANTLTLDVNIHDIRSNGLWLSENSTGLNFTGEIYRCGLNGIFLGAIGTATLHDFSIHHIGQQANEPWPIDINVRKHSGFGIAVFDQQGEVLALPHDITVQDFEVYQVANIGVAPYGDNWIIENFNVYEWGSRFEDCGGIHPFYSNALGTGLSTANGIVRNGLVHDGIGSHEGIANYTQPSLVSGLYFDSGTEDWEVDNVHSFDNPMCGFFSNWNGKGTNIHDSFFAGNRGHLGQVFYLERPNLTESPNFLHNHENDFNNNIVIAGGDTHCIMSASDGGGNDPNYNPFTSGTINNNTYFTLGKGPTTDTNPVALNSMAKRSNSTVNNFSVRETTAHVRLSFASWQSLVSGDAASTSSGFYYDAIALQNSIPQVNTVYNDTGVTDDFAVDPSNTYNDLAGSTVNSYNLTPLEANAGVIKPSIHYLLMDHFIGTNGSTISGRTPTIGNNALVLSGTHTVNSQNGIQSSSAGIISWNVGQANYVKQVRMLNTVGGQALRVDDRYADATLSTTHRLITDITTATGVRIRENNDSGTLTEIGTAVPFTVVADRYYVIRVELNGSNMKVYVDDVLYRNETVNVTTGNYSAVFSSAGSNFNKTDYIVVHPLP